MSDKSVGKVIDAKVAEAKDQREVWVSRAFSQHTVIVQVDGQSYAVKFNEYRKEFDLSNDKERKLSQAMRNCGRLGRDLFIVGKALPVEDVKGRADLLRILREMSVPQLRAIVSGDALVENQIQPSTRDPDELIAVIMNNCSI